MKQYSTTLILIVFFTVLSGCTTTQTQPEVTEAEVAQPEFTRRTMLTDIGQVVIMPVHEQFLVEAKTLAEVLHQVKAEPTVDTLNGAQEQWRITALAWRRVEPFSLRFAMIVHNQINKWPTNIGFIDKFIASEEVIDEPFIESIGSTSKGLPAIEYLLFDVKLSQTEILAQLTDTPRRLDYLAALGDNLARKADELLALWSTEGDNQLTAFIEADFSGGELQGSISMQANELIALVETITQQRVGRPMKGTYGTPVPEAAEAHQAEYSLPLVIESLHGFQQAFNGGDKLGFDDYLDYLEAQYHGQTLSTAINEQTEQTIVALQAIDEPLHLAVINQPEVVQAAYDELKQLIVLTKVDMANHLGITVTFSDNDGD